MAKENIFDTSIQKTNLILKDIEEQLDWLPSKHSAYSLLRAVLQTLRDRLTVDEVASLGAQLPLIVRGMFYEGWKPSRLPIKFNKDEFIGEVERKFPTDPEISTEKIIKKVIEVLKKHTANGEVNDIKSILPGEFAVLFPD